MAEALLVRERGVVHLYPDRLADGINDEKEGATKKKDYICISHTLHFLGQTERGEQKKYVQGTYERSAG